MSNARQEGYRKGGIQDRWDAELQGCKKGGIQEMRDAKFGSEMANISAIFFATAIAPFSFLLLTATCATFFSLRQWRGGAKNGASAQHWTSQCS